MWVKLGNEYLNLDQVVRVRFNKTFRAGQDEWAAEVEGLIKGELQIFTRYRGPEAAALHAILCSQTAPAAPAHPSEPAVALTNTVHDLKIT
jgi:hypothetical protein